MIIGLYGDSRSGKDTIAKILVEKFEFEWRAFATPLRQILSRINPYLVDWAGEGIRYNDAIEQFGLDGVKQHYPEAVEYMIALGQSVRDFISEDAWVWGVFNNQPLPENMVISDVRQPNEYEAIFDSGGEIWRVIRPGTVRRGMDGLLDDRPFNVTIYNNGDIDTLRTVIEREVQNAQDRWFRSRFNDGISIIHD